VAVNKNKNNDGDMPKKGSTSKSISKQEKAMIEDLFRDAIQDFAVKYESKRLSRIEMVERISGFLSEFLSAFMIIGYDMKGQPINVFHAASQMDADALSSALNKFVFNIHNNNE
jgi:hypothetical protein